jgi:hypothetical protein
MRTVTALLGLAVLGAAPAEARRPVVAYIHPTTGVFSLYDTETSADVAAPTLPTGITRLGVSSNGRYVVYRHPSTGLIRLFDRQVGGEVALPGIDVTTPASLTVSDTGLIAFDDNGNGPARVYDSSAGAFVSTGLPASNGHRQTRLSGDGSRLATTCLGGAPATPCVVDRGADGAVFVQDLSLDADTGFPDDVVAAGASENRPCLDADGSLVGFDYNAGGATGNNVYLYDRSLGALVPVPLQSASPERECALDADGAYVGVFNDTGDLRIYDRAGGAFLTLPAQLQGLAAPAWLTQPFPPPGPGPAPSTPPPSGGEPTPPPRTGVGPRRPQRGVPPPVLTSALDATNALIAEPWAALARQTMKKYPDRDREPRTLADEKGSKKVAGIKVSWSLWLKGRSITPFADIRRPPGFSALSPSRFTLEVPLDGRWKFGWDGELAARARLKAGGETIFSWSPKVGFGLELSDIKIEAGARLDAGEPERPLLELAGVRARARLRGRGAIPVNDELVLVANLRPKRLVLTEKIKDMKIDLGSRNARVTADVKIDILPTERPLTIEGETPEVEGRSLRTHLAVGFADVRFSLKGAMSIRLPRVGEVELPFSLGWRTGLIPTSEQLLDFFDLIAPPRPRSHGEDEPPAPFPTPADGGYRALADRFEANLDDFLPWDTVLSRTWRTLDPPELNQYAVEADSAIWTGHLMAAESYRWATVPAAERGPAAARLAQLLTGMERLFAVTEDAVIVKRKRRPVARRLRGLFARVVRRDGDEGKIGPALAERKCYYEWAEGGWRARRGRPRTRTFDSFAAAVEAGLGESVEPVAPVWHGWGCSDDHPLTRDQYAGVALGLATLLRVVEDPALRERAKALYVRLLDYLLRNDWNVVLPPENEAASISSFMGQWDKQLALLAVGAVVAPERYADDYNRYKAAAATTWLPPWSSALDPILQYFKFNLSHAWATMLMTYETDPVARAGYQYEYDVLRRSIRHHRNPYFDLIRILAAPPEQRAAVRDGPSDAFDDITMGEQIRATLFEYLIRQGLQPGPDGRPTNANSAQAAAFQHGLWPAKVTRFVVSDGTPVCTATSALPVWARGGERQDFMWQMDPFSLAAEEGACPARFTGGPPSMESLVATGASPKREGPGVDYLLAYWMAAYLGVVPLGA